MNNTDFIEKYISKCQNLIENPNDEEYETFIRDLRKIIAESSLKEDFLQRFLDIINMKHDVSYQRRNIERIEINCSKNLSHEPPEFIDATRKEDAPNRDKLIKLEILLQEIKEKLEINEFIKNKK